MASSSAIFKSESAITTADTSCSTADRIEWSRSTILNFIEDYRCQRVLWDPNTKGYHIKQTKYEALKTLGHKYGTEIRAIRSKIKSLRSSFHREHGKVINGRRKGVHYQPMWFAYEAIRFILDGESQSHSQRTHAENTGGYVDEAGEVLEEKHCSDTINKNTNDNNAELLEDEHLMGSEVLAYDEELKVETLLNATPTTQISLRAAAVTASTTPTTIAAVPTATLATNNNSASAADINIVARFVAAAAVASTNTNNNNSNSKTNTSINIVTIPTEGREAAVIRSDFDGDLQTYCNISADDIKTEIIESDAPDLVLVSRPPPTFIPRKRKMPHTSNELAQFEDVPSPSKQSHHSHDQQQTQHSNSTGSEAASTTAAETNNDHQPDEYGVFGEYVAITIRKLKTSKAKIVVKHLINNLLYEAEMGKYDHGISASKEPPQLYKL